MHHTLTASGGKIYILHVQFHGPGGGEGYTLNIYTADEERDTPGKYKLLQWKGIHMHVHTAGVRRDTPCTSKLQVVERDTSCRFILAVLLYVEKSEV
jgi:hypothetical protein